MTVLSENRIRIAIILTLPLCCIILQVLSLIDIIVSPQKVSSEDITFYEKRFKNLIRVLPSNGTVGYFSDCIEDVYNVNARLYITQYALAPVIIVKSVDSQFIVGNFCDSVITPGSNYELIFHSGKDLSKGVTLFKRK